MEVVGGIPVKTDSNGNGQIMQLTTGSSKEKVIDLGGSLPSSIELDIHKWLQD